MAEQIGSPKESGYPKYEPASEVVIEALVQDSGLALPLDYLNFLRSSNGTECDLGIWPGYVILWAAESIIDRNNAYCLPEYIPGFFAFGSDGGGEMLVWDTRKPQPWPVFAMPFVGMEEGAEMPVAENFGVLVTQLGKRYDEKGR